MIRYSIRDTRPIRQFCTCGTIVRIGISGYDYDEATIKCAKCHKMVKCEPIVMFDRFSGLEQIFAEHRIQDVPGYGSSRLSHPPNFPVEEEEFDGPFE